MSTTPSATEQATSNAQPTEMKDASESKSAGSDLPRLSAHDFRSYNRLAEHMDMFHNHFRAEWNSLYSACEANKRPSNQSIRSFVSAGLSFCSHLNMHHGIEEQYVFPMLGKKMPAFRNKDELLGQHKQIHAGLEKMESYLEQCQSGERELRLVELREIMDGFGGVLWEHLDDEVRTLGAENMRKYWTKDEMSRLRL